LRKEQETKVLSCKKHEEDDNTARAEDIKDYK
jgi:hypothetical protein